MTEGNFYEKVQNAVEADCRFRSGSGSDGFAVCGDLACDRIKSHVKGSVRHLLWNLPGENYSENTV